MVKIVENYKKIIFFLLLIIFIPIKVDAATLNVAPDRVTFYSGLGNNNSFVDSTPVSTSFGGNPVYDFNSGSNFAPMSARIFYLNGQFANTPKNKNTTLYFNIFSTYVIQSVNIDTAGNYFSCSILNTSYFEDSNLYNYVIMCDKMQFVSSNFYINTYFNYNNSSQTFNGHLGVSQTFTYLLDSTAQEIVDGINGEDKPQTPVDDSKVNDYESKEENMINKDNLDKIDNIAISIDANSNLFVWQIIEQFLNTHELIFGMIITILSVGVIKLILNR